MWAFWMNGKFLSLPEPATHTGAAGFFSPGVEYRLEALSVRVAGRPKLVLWLEEFL